MSLKTTIENYKLAEQLHKDIDDAFNSLDQDEITSQQSEKILSDIRRLELVLAKINVEDLKEKYDDSFIEDVQHNVDFFFDAADYIKKYLYGRKYYDLIIGPITSYIGKVYYGPGNHRELARKFAAMLTHRDNIMTFMNYIKRIAVGTMSDTEFKKIFNSNKHKIIGGMSAFESFNCYLKNELCE
ncbi:MAG: hypothetical protein WC554_13955 [Clostridia bacterium]